MATPLPLPLRVAVGAIALGLEHARRLPAELPELSVTVAGKAVRASMRIQQQITELAARGEEVLSDAFPQATARPAWARFDEEEADDAAPDDAAPDDGDAAAAVPHGNANGNESAAVDDAHARGVSAADEDMPGYDDLRLAQVRARMRSLDVAALTRLLDYERDHAARAPFLTMLANRITTLESPHQAGNG